MDTMGYWIYIWEQPLRKYGRMTIPQTHPHLLVGSPLFPFPNQQSSVPPTLPRRQASQMHTWWQSCKEIQSKSSNSLLPKILSETHVSRFLLHHASTMEWEEQQETPTEGKHWCEHGKVSLHDWLRSLQAPCSYPKDWLDETPRANLHGPGGVKAGSIYRGEAYWHLCWVLSRSTGFRK